MSHIRIAGPGSTWDALAFLLPRDAHAYITADIGAVQHFEPGGQAWWVIR